MIKRTLLLSLFALYSCSSDDGTSEGMPSDSEAMNSSEKAGAQSDAVQFINLRVDEISVVRAVVRFETSEPTTCEAIFGTNPETLDNTAIDPDMEEGELAVEHVIPLEDLKGDQKYYWRGKITDAEGNTYVSELNEFSTLTAGSTMVTTNFASIAEGTTVIDVSSNFGNADNDATWGIENALDGMMATEWSSNGDGDDAWVMLNFGRMRTLKQFKYRSRKMSNDTSIVQSVQLVLDDGQTVLGPFMTPDPDQSYTFDLDPPISTDSIRVEAVKTTGGNTGAKEIQFF